MRCGLLLSAAFCALLSTSCVSGSRLFDERADLILRGGRVYSLSWDDPDPDGNPASNAPVTAGRWHPDAEAVAIRGQRILFVGSNTDVLRYQAPSTRVVDVRGACVLPGFVDAHTHVAGLGRSFNELSLIGVASPEEAVRLAVEWSKKIPKGEWVIGRGWDEGAWANRYPNWDALNELIPDHPVVLDGLHGFATWANRLAFERAGITRDTPSPSGGRIPKDGAGNLTGILLDNATDMLANALPETSLAQRKKYLRDGLEEMARSGYTAVHEAGVHRGSMEALEELNREDALPIRFYCMIAATDDAVVRTWLERGPMEKSDGMLTVRSVKAYYDASLGARGARLIEDYADRPGHRGVSGDDYGFDQDVVAKLVARGFQVCIHAIGDLGNRETLDFFERVFSQHPDAQNNRHRIEHAQIIHPDDWPRFRDLSIIASMQPPHCVEDKAWAEDRLGRERLVGAYAWRSLRRTGVRLAFGSDLSGSDHDIFYGLHSAITRRSKDLQPPGGWLPNERMTVEEAVRGYTIWPAYAAFMETHTGTLEAGKLADLTVIDLDPFTLEDPGVILGGRVLVTVANGRIVYQR